MKCSSSYTIAVIADGDDGVGVKSITAYYAVSATAVQPDISTFTDTPQPVDKDNRFLWYYEKTEYTDDRTPVETTPILIGVYGEQGKDGESGSSPVDAILSSYSVVLPCDGNGVISGTDLSVSVSVVQAVGQQYRSLSLATDTLTRGKFSFSLTLDGITEVSASGLGIVGSSSSAMLKNPAYIDVNFEYIDFYGSSGTTTKKICLTQSPSTQALEGIKKSIEETDNAIGLKVTKGADGSATGYTLAGVSVGTADGNTGYIKLDGDAIIADGTISAEKIDVSSLFAKEIVFPQKTFSVDEQTYNSQIRSNNYDRNGKFIGTGEEAQGFYLDSTGTFKASGAVFSDVQITDGEFTSPALDTKNEDVSDDINYTKAFPTTCYYMTDLINAQVNQIAECATGSNTSSSTCTVVYDGTTYSGTVRRFDSHTEWGGTNDYLSATGLTVTKSVTIPEGTVGRITNPYNAVQYAKWHTDDYTTEEEEYVEPTYEWVTKFLANNYGTAPDDQTEPSNPSEGDIYYTYTHGSSGMFAIYQHTYTKTADGYWTTITVVHQGFDANIAMTLQNTTLTKNGTSYSLNTWLSAGTYTFTKTYTYFTGEKEINDEWVNITTAGYTGSYKWDVMVKPYIQLYLSYSRYYGLGIWFGTTKWSNLSSEWTTKDVQITLNGSVTLQAGTSYDTWIGATKRAPFVNPIKKGIFSITSGTWNGTEVTDGILQSNESSITYESYSYRVGAMYTEDEWLPTINLSYVSEGAGCYVEGGIYPKTADTARLGLSGKKFKELWINDIYTTNVEATKTTTSTIEGLTTCPTLGTCLRITDWNDAYYNGFYMGYNIPNAPTSGKWYFGEVICHGGAGWCMQTVYPFADGIKDMRDVPVYRRFKYAGTWCSWGQINKYSGTIIYAGYVSGTVNLWNPLTSYEWIEVEGWTTSWKYIPLFIHSSRWSGYSSASERFVLSTDTKYCSFYFPAVNQICSYDSNIDSYIRVVGYN